MHVYQNIEKGLNKIDKLGFECQIRILIELEITLSVVVVK